MAYTSTQYPPNHFDFEGRSPYRNSQGAYYSNVRFSSYKTPSPRASPNPKPSARRASQGHDFHQANWKVPPNHTTHSSPRYSANFSSPPPPREFVSGFDPRGAKSRRESDGAHHKRPQWSSDDKKHSFFANVVEGDYGVYGDAPPPYEARGKYAFADYSGFKTQDAFRTPEPERPRTSHRRPTTSGRGSSQQSTPKRNSTSHKSPPKRVATEDDARRAGIPAGYSFKNWDPAEEPITLLGSVFDANSLGKWVYDWTVYRYGAATPFSDMSGDLWLLLIQLAGKVKRADHLMPRIRREDSREMVEDFLESGERLWIRFKKLLKICEDHMWKAAKRSTGEKKPMSMGKESGCVFVDSLFGRDRELDKTEKLMSAIRLWSMRFDANCEEILRNPTA